MHEIETTPPKKIKQQQQQQNKQSPLVEFPLIFIKPLAKNHTGLPPSTPENLNPVCPSVWERLRNNKGTMKMKIIVRKDL